MLVTGACLSHIYVEATGRLMRKMPIIDVTHAGRVQDQAHGRFTCIAGLLCFGRRHVQSACGISCTCQLGGCTGILVYTPS